MQPSYFLDRSLGDHQIPDGLRDAGWSIVTMRERYGRLDAQSLADVDWIADSAARGELMLTADKMIAKRPREAHVVTEAAARVIALSDGRKTASEQLEQILKFEKSIRKAAALPGPFVLSLSTRGLTELHLHDRAVGGRD
jgi:hypothetical protein